MTGLALISLKTAMSTKVDVVHPEPGGIRRLTIQPGTVQAFESADLYAKASGFLKSQSVDIGSRVKQGEVLAELDAPELQEDVEQASASHEQAGRANPDQALARISTAEAESATATASEAQARTDIDRLAAKRSMTQKQYERVKRPGMPGMQWTGSSSMVLHQLDYESGHRRGNGRDTPPSRRPGPRRRRPRPRSARPGPTWSRPRPRLPESSRSRLDRARVLAGYQTQDWRCRSMASSRDGTSIRALLDPFGRRRNLRQCRW